MSVCSLVLQYLCNLSSIVSICASILFLKSWVIFSIITLNSFSDELLITSSFSHSCKFLSCFFTWNFIVCHFTFSDLFCLCSPFCRLQDFISSYLWSLPLSGWSWLRGFSCYPLDGGGGGRGLISVVVNRAYPRYWTGLPLYAYHWGTLLPSSDVCVRSFPYLFYTLIKLYYTKSLSNQALSLAPDWILLIQRPRILASFVVQQQTFILGACPGFFRTR